MKRLYWIAGLLLVPILALAIMHRNDPLLFTLGTGILVMIGVVLNLFVGIYLRRNWRETTGGRAIMYSVASLAALTDLSLMTAFLGPDWEWRAAVRLIVFGGILLAHAHLLWVLITAPYRDDIPPEPHEGEER